MDESADHVAGPQLLLGTVNDAKVDGLVLGIAEEAGVGGDHDLLPLAGQDELVAIAVGSQTGFNGGGNGDAVVAQGLGNDGIDVFVEIVANSFAAHFLDCSHF